MKTKVAPVHHGREWMKIRAAVLKRDRYKCVRCQKKQAVGFPLTAHHITPRSQEGTDNLNNLIALCGPCHDEVELLQLRTPEEIIGSYEGVYPVEVERKPAELDDGKLCFMDEVTTPEGTGLLVGRSQDSSQLCVSVRIPYGDNIIRKPPYRTFTRFYPTDKVQKVSNTATPA